MDKLIDIQLPTYWTLWSHTIDNKDWSIESHSKITIIDTVSKFWRLFNNFHKLNYRSYNFYLMKENITPIWEDLKNKNGGICSFKIEISNFQQLWEDVGIYTLSKNLVDIEHANEITGISISHKNNWMVIKIWNNKPTNIANLFSKEFRDKCDKFSTKYVTHQK